MPEIEFWPSLPLAYKALQSKSEAQNPTLALTTCKAGAASESPFITAPRI
jgi:hypothetical protein